MLKSRIWEEFVLLNYEFEQIDSLKAQHNYLEKQLDSVKAASHPDKNELDRLKELKNIIAAEETEINKLVQGSKKLKEKVRNGFKYLCFLSICSSAFLHV